MTLTYKTEDKIEKVILIAIDFDDSKSDINMNLEELAELAKTSGAEVVGILTQKRNSVNNAHYFGKGKIEELKNLILELNATSVICDDELTSTQLKNLSDMLDIKIIDRTLLILDIFAKHANSSEGKVQVELAQLKYRLSHLSGIGSSMSRLGGGIGSKGPGEKKLELDRRHIKDRISELNKELQEIETHRNLLREKRTKNSIPIVSLIGYTNSGKSTIMNYFTEANVLSQDKLFATLDTTIRKLKLPIGEEILMTDTVGFIQKLPHTLIKSFKSTLDELKNADILIHVVDSSNPYKDKHIEVVYSLLNELNCINKPIITVFNKIDKCIEEFSCNDEKATKIIKISAKMGTNCNLLLESLEEILQSFKKPLKILIPFSDGLILNYIYNSTQIILKEYREEGVYIECFVDNEAYNKLKLYSID